MDNNQLQNYIDVLKQYNHGTPFSQELLIEKQGGIEVYFSPFEYVNQQAKIVLVGISPGATQADNANIKAKEMLLDSADTKTVSKEAKQTGAFSGALRNNLVKMLDYIGLNQKLEISSCQSLFDEHSYLLHSTSVFRYPTLLNGKPISSAKKALTTPLLKNMIDACLVQECSQLASTTFYLPMGQGVDTVLLDLCQKGILDRQQLLIGLPHPSGANAERISYFLGAKERSELSDKTNADKIDSAKKVLLNQLIHLDGTKTNLSEEQPAPPRAHVKPNNKYKSKPVADIAKLNMVSPSYGYMLESLERQMRDQLSELGLTVKPSKSRSSKELAILKGADTVAYVSRKTGLKKGAMVVALHPRTGNKLDNVVGDLEGVTISPGKNSRYISSSNYNGFDSKGFSSQLLSNEHQAAAFRVDVSNGLSAFKSLLRVC